MMKCRNIWLAVIAGVSLSLAGCSGSSSDAADTASDESALEEEAAEASGTSEAETEEDGNSAEEGSDSTEEDADSISVSAADASDLLLEWKTTQYFTDEAVAQEDIEKILEAGINTTSSMNGQPWHFTAVTDSEILEEISSSMSFGGGGAAPSGDFSAEDLPEDFASVSGEDETIEAPEMEISAADSEDASPKEEAAETEEDASATEENGESQEAASETDAAEESQEATSESETAGESQEVASETDAAGESQEAATRSKAALGDTPLAIIVSCADGSELDAGLATQSMFIEARLLGYGAKIVSSPTMVLNGEDADYYRELLGIPEDYSVVSVLLIGYEDTSVDTTADGMTGASERLDESEVVTYIE